MVSAPFFFMRNPPQPIPENLLGERWRFASIPAGDLIDAFGDRSIPIKSIPELLTPIKLGLASTVAIPGVVIDAGRRSMPLARWLQSVEPVALDCIAGAPDGLILDAGATDRWILATFEDAEMRSAAQLYGQRKQTSNGLHFLLVQPDDSGMTYTGFWLLKRS